ncbi:MAG: HU family DNA-binding protein [Chloroflexota bacterium]
MTVKFTVVPRKDPRDPALPPKYYAAAKSSGRADTNEIAKQVTRMSTISSADTMAMLEAFLTIVPDQLAEGKIVELGEFGTFRISLSSQGSEDADAVTAANISEARVIFTPGRRFKDVLATLKYQKEAAD